MWKCLMAREAPSENLCAWLCSQGSIWGQTPVPLIFYVQQLTVESLCPLLLTNRTTLMLSGNGLEV